MIKKNTLHKCRWLVESVDASSVTRLRHVLQPLRSWRSPQQRHYTSTFGKHLDTRKNPSDFEAIRRQSDTPARVTSLLSATPICSMSGFICLSVWKFCHVTWTHKNYVKTDSCWSSFLSSSVCRLFSKFTFTSICLFVCPSVSQSVGYSLSCSLVDLSSNLTSSTNGDRTLILQDAKNNIGLAFTKVIIFPAFVIVRVFFASSLQSQWHCGTSNGVKSQ